MTHPVLVTVAIFVTFAVPGRGSAQELIAEIRVHGNHTTPDADILRLSGLTMGTDVSDAAIRGAERTLRESGRFAGVEIRRRYRSIDDPTAILLIIVIDEHPAVSDDDLTPGWGKRVRSAGMWLPVLGYADGYGFTYGARVSFVDVAGDRSRFSVPLTWGAERRVAAELERSFDGPISLVRGSVGLSRRVNPHFNVSDVRQDARVEAERQWTTWLRSGVTARITDVGFGPADDVRHTAGGFHIVVDTRVNPSFPRNAVHARVGWERLGFSGEAVAGGAEGPPRRSTRAGRWLSDLRGYVGIGGSAVLALRGQITRADAPLPLAEQTLVGGGDSLRGYRAGHLAGDSAALVSAEVRLPLNSPLSTGRLGVKGFVDAGTTWAAGTRLRDQRFDRGIGAGIYCGAGPLIADLDVAWPEQGNARVHFGLGVSF